MSIPAGRFSSTSTLKSPEFPAAHITVAFLAAINALHLSALADCEGMLLPIEVPHEQLTHVGPSRAMSAIKSVLHRASAMGIDFALLSKILTKWTWISSSVSQSGRSAWEHANPPWGCGIVSLHSGNS